MREIQLTRGYVARVSDEDYEWASQYRWHANVSARSRTVYAVRWLRGEDGKRRLSRMHREIVRRMYGGVLEQVDHIDLDGLNNVRSNLRAATNTENHWNEGLRSSNTSGFIGVSRAPGGRCFTAGLSVQGEWVYLGLYDTAEDAARARDHAALMLRGGRARLNFPHLRDEYLKEINATTISGEDVA